MEKFLLQSFISEGRTCFVVKLFSHRHFLCLLVTTWLKLLADQSSCFGFHCKICLSLEHNNCWFYCNWPLATILKTHSHNSNFKTYSFKHAPLQSVNCHQPSHTFPHYLHITLLPSVSETLTCLLSLTRSSRGTCLIFSHTAGNVFFGRNGLPWVMFSFRSLWRRFMESQIMFLWTRLCAHGE